MEERERENLREELLELEGMLRAAQRKADEINERHGVKFLALHPGWTYPKKAPWLQLQRGIRQAAEALGNEMVIVKDFGHEEARMIHRGCEYTQLPKFDGPRYLEAYEK